MGRAHRRVLPSGGGGQARAPPVRMPLVRVPWLRWAFVAGTGAPAAAVVVAVRAEVSRVKVNAFAPATP